MKTVLITSGGCEEPIDGVRNISNFSTGKTGAFLAEFFASKGTEVILLKAAKAVIPRQLQYPGGGNISIREFRSFRDLQALLEQEAKTDRPPEMLILAAAVSDFSVAAVHIGSTTYAPRQLDKINSSGEDRIMIELNRNPKLIDRVMEIFPSALVVGFKLTRKAGESEKLAAVKTLAEHSKAGLIVHNDLSEIGEGRHNFTLYRTESGNGGTEVIKTASGPDKQALAELLYSCYAERLGPAERKGQG